MLHAFDATSGAELWAYVPRVAYPRLNALSDPLYSHQFTVDGTPTVRGRLRRTTVGSGDWRTILVGGLAAGGPGFYALDITDPIASSEAGTSDSATQKVLWEFPNASTAAGVREQHRLLVRQAGDRENPREGLGRAGDLRLQQHGRRRSGSSVRPRREDRRGHPRHRHHGVGTSADPSGLAQISAWANNAALDATIDFVYGGDLKGNLWRFDLSSTSATELERSQARHVHQRDRRRRSRSPRRRSSPRSTGGAWCTWGPAR